MTSRTTSGAHAEERTGIDEAVVVIRRNVWLSGVVAGLAAVIGLGYLLRGHGLLDTLAGLVLLLVAALHVVVLASARVPVLVADEHGIRLRVGLTWRGLPWGSLRQVVVEHADNPLREGRLVVVPRDPRSSMDYLTVLGRLNLRWNELWYGAALSVPLGLTTTTDSTDLGGDLSALADGRTDVVHLRGRQLAQLDEVVAPPRPEVEPEAAFELPPPPEDDLDDELSGDGQGGLEGAVMPGEVHGDVETTDEIVLPEPVDPVRPLSLPARVEVRLDDPAIGRESGHVVPAQRLPDLEAPQPHLDEQEVPDLVHAEAWEDVPVEIEVDDLTVHAPHEPVIGAKIVHAREMLDMSIEELSERTRIRPHVLEAIEVDDFGPCGGDFYARGHLTTISRVLGLTLEPLMKEYDDRYAGGPINARRVFEAELATGMSSGMRATRGGPQWTMLIGAVLCLALVWGVARLLSGDPSQVAVPPAGGGESAGLAAHQQPITSPLMKTTPMTVTAAHAGAHVAVKDRTGRVLWSGDLPMTHHRKIVGLAPFKVETDNGGAIEVTVDGDAMGTVGVAGKAGSKRFG
ncbi:cytoskeleton protein RodZ [Marmoricola sp. URHA0025 HA25]